MAFFVGFDASTFPGDDRLAWLKANTNLSWCGYYLGPTPSHSGTSWMGKRAALATAGWGAVPVYLGRQTVGPGSHDVSVANGTLDGEQAAGFAKTEGFARGSFVFLDIEDGSAMSPVVVGYVKAWSGAVAAGGYAPGVYCSHVIANQVASAFATLVPPVVPKIWAFKVATTATHPFAGDLTDVRPQDPAGSGFAAASIWQFEQNCVATVDGSPIRGLQLDLNHSKEPDPSRGAMPASEVPSFLAGAQAIAAEGFAANKVPARKATAKKAASKKVPAKKVSSKAVPEKVVPTKTALKTAASKKVATKKAATRKVASKKAASNKTATKKVSTRKAATQKAATQKAATRKIATEKVAATRAAPKKRATKGARGPALR